MLSLAFFVINGFSPTLRMAQRRDLSAWQAFGAFLPSQVFGARCGADPRLQISPVCSLAHSLQVQTVLCRGFRVPVLGMVGSP